MAEIGVFRSFGACLMVAHLRNEERLILIDMICCLDHCKDAIVEMAAEAFLDRITFCQADSMRLGPAGRLSLDREHRFFHIDGEHSYDGVMNNLKIASEAISPAGIIVVDGFFGAASPAIAHAVFNYIGQSDTHLSLFLLMYINAYLCSNRRLGFYREATTGLTSALEIHGYPVQLTASGFAFECTYFGISARASEHPCQLIGAFVPEAERLLSSTNRYW